MSMISQLVLSNIQISSFYFRGGDAGRNATYLCYFY